MAAASASAQVRDNPFAPVVPNHILLSRADKSGAPAPPGVGQPDIDNDFEMIRRAADLDPEDDGASMTDAGHVNAGEFREKLLDQALGIQCVAPPYRLPLAEAGPATVGARIERPSWTGFAQVVPYFEHEQNLRENLGGNENGVVAPVTGFGVMTGAGASGGALTGGGGSLAAALQGRIGGGGEAMSRATSAGGGVRGVRLVVGGGGGGGGGWCELAMM